MSNQSPPNDMGISHEIPPFAMMPGWVLGSRISFGAKILYGVIAFHRNPSTNAEVWASQKTLGEWLVKANGSPTTEQTIGVWLKELTDLGCIVVRRERSQRGIKNFYKVRVTIPAGFTGPTSTSEWYDRRDKETAAQSDHEKSKGPESGNPENPDPRKSSAPDPRFFQGPDPRKSTEELEPYELEPIEQEPIKNTLAPLDESAALFDAPEASSVAAGSKDSKVKTGNDDGMLRFGEFWNAYGHKKARGAAEKAWRQAVKVADVDKIIAAAAEVHAWHVKAQTDARWIKHPATWLNQKCWEDDLSGNLVASNGKGHVPFTQDRNIWNNLDTDGWKVAYDQ